MHMGIRHTNQFKRNVVFFSSSALQAAYEAFDCGGGGPARMVGFSSYHAAFGGGRESWNGVAGRLLARRVPSSWSER